MQDPSTGPFVVAQDGVRVNGLGEGAWGRGEQTYGRLRAEYPRPLWIPDGPRFLLAQEYGNDGAGGVPLLVG